jgi:polyketide synthase PksL
VPLPAYAFARKRYWVGQGSLKKTAANRGLVRQDISAGVVLKDAMFDVRWREMALDSGVARSQIPVDTLLVISEDPAVFETSHWGEAKVRSCLITDDVQPEGRYDTILGKERLDYEILREQIRSGGIDCVVYVPSSIDIETSSSEHLEQHLRWESHKLHRWMMFLINNLVETPPKVFFLSLMQHPGQDPVQALLSKYFSFLRYEYPEFQASIIRVDRLGKETMAQVHAEISSRSNETEVAFHEQERQVQRLIPLTLTDREHEFDASGCMVISGGFGGIGFKVLQWLIDKGTTELIVIGRKPATAILQHPDLDAPLAIQALIDKLGQQGVVVHYIQVDIHQPQHLAEAFEAVRGRLQQPITGVFHLAGITTDAIPLGDMSEDTLIEVLRPKFFGAYALDKITAEDSLRYFCLFSSTAAIEGMQVNGLGAYAASNASLDALAELRRQRHKPVQLIHWSDWDEVGMAVAHGHKAFMDAVGIHMLSPASAIGILEAVLTQSIPSSTVFHVDWEKFSRANGLLGKLPFFADYVRAMDQRSAPKAQATVFAKETGDAKEIDVAKLHSEASSVRQGQMSCEQLVTHLSEKLAAMMEIEAVSPEESLSDLGLDSINSIQYFKELSVELTVDISPSLTFRYPTISKLAKYLSSQVPARLDSDAETEKPGFSVTRQLQAAMRRSEQLLAHTE